MDMSAQIGAIELELALQFARPVAERLHEIKGSIGERIDQLAHWIALQIGGEEGTLELFAYRIDQILIETGRVLPQTYVAESTGMALHFTEVG